MCNGMGEFDRGDDCKRGCDDGVFGIIFFIGANLFNQYVFPLLQEIVESNG